MVWIEVAFYESQLCLAAVIQIRKRINDNQYRHDISTLGRSSDLISLISTRITVMT